MSTVRAGKGLLTTPGFHLGTWCPLQRTGHDPEASLEAGLSANILPRLCLFEEFPNRMLSLCRIQSLLSYRMIRRPSKPQNPTHQALNMFAFFPRHQRGTSSVTLCEICRLLGPELGRRTRNGLWLTCLDATRKKLGYFVLEN